MAKRHVNNSLVMPMDAEPGEVTRYTPQALYPESGNSPQEWLEISTKVLATLEEAENSVRLHRLRWDQRVADDPWTTSEKPLEYRVLTHVISTTAVECE